MREHDHGDAIQAVLDHEEDTTAQQQPVAVEDIGAAEVERELVELRRASFQSEDLREGVRAFAQKRPARWKGR